MINTLRTLYSLYRTISAILSRKDIFHYAFGGFVRDMELYRLSQNGTEESSNISKFLENKINKTKKNDIDIAVLIETHVIIETIAKITDELRDALTFHCLMLDKSYMVHLNRQEYQNQHYDVATITIKIDADEYSIDLVEMTGREHDKHDFTINCLAYSNPRNDRLCTLMNEDRLRLDDVMADLRQFRAMPCQSFIKAIENAKKNHEVTDLLKQMQRIVKMNEYGFEVVGIPMPIRCKNEVNETYLIPEWSSPGFIVKIQCMNESNGYTRRNLFRTIETTHRYMTPEFRGFRYMNFKFV
jgi:hypothetical protein